MRLTELRSQPPSRAARFAAALALTASGSVRGCSLGARPICYPEPESESASLHPAPPWADAADTVSDASHEAGARDNRVVVRPMRCHYPGAGPLAPPELRA
jgi:hypothetical protein